MTYKYKTEEKIIERFAVGITLGFVIFFILVIIFSPIGRVVLGSFIFIVIGSYLLGWGALSLHGFYKKFKVRKV